MKVYVYDAITIAAGILSNRQMRATNYIYNHVLCWTEEKVKKCNIILRLTICQMHELALHYMQWQRQTEGVDLSKTPV